MQKYVLDNSHLSTVLSGQVVKSIQKQPIFNLQKIIYINKNKIKLFVIACVDTSTIIILVMLAGNKGIISSGVGEKWRVFRSYNS